MITQKFKVGGYKNKKRIANDKENHAVFLNVHEPIIERAVWENLQNKRSTTRKRKKADGEKEYVFGFAGMRRLLQQFMVSFQSGKSRY